MASIDHNHRTPFDHESEAGPDDADLTQEFWGSSRGWQPNRGHQEVAQARRDDTTGAIRAIRDGMAAFRPQRVDLRDSTGQVRRTRTHGAAVPAANASHDVSPDEVSIAELAGGATAAPSAYDPFLDDPDLDDHFLIDPVRDDPYAGAGDRSDEFVDHGDDDLVPLSSAGPRRTRPGLGAVDPLLARFGAMALVGVLLVPVALALRPSDPAPDSVRIDAPTITETGSPAGGGEPESATGAVAESDTSSAAGEATEAEATADVAAAPAEQVAVGSEPAASPESAPAQQAQGDGAPAATEAVVDTQSAPAAASDGAIDDAATVAEPAERVVPECPQTYTAGAGDSWYRIADAAGVSPDAVMAENRATNDTVILPGDEICLPADASIPLPPPAPEPAATATPTTTSPPTTTTAPTTTSAPAAPAAVEEVKAMIRATWPEEEHETAMMIANRESRFNPRADNNWCCYGVFQIYFTVHQSWLDDFGVYQASDLFDAEKNIAAAYHLYQQSGGWGPWGF